MALDDARRRTKGPYDGTGGSPDAKSPRKALPCIIVAVMLILAGVGTPAMAQTTGCTGAAETRCVAAGTHVTLPDGANITATAAPAVSAEQGGSIKGKDIIIDATGTGAQVGAVSVNGGSIIPLPADPLPRMATAIMG